MSTTWPPPWGSHRRDAARDLEEAAQVHAGDVVEVLVRVVGERLGDEDAGVVDHGVDPAEPRDGGVDDARADAGLAMSPATVSTIGSSDGVDARELATTA